MTEPIDFESLSDRELNHLVRRALPALGFRGRINSEVRLLPGVRPDFVVHADDGRVSIVEAKGGAIRTRTRLRSAAEQLSNYGAAYIEAHLGSEQPDLALVTSEALSPENREFLHELGIQSVFDGSDLRDALGLSRRSGLSFDDSGILDVGQDSTREEAFDLSRRLREIAPGRKMWMAYQATVAEILRFTLCPPLRDPIFESSNESGVNRRDIILPNYAAGGFWSYMRDTYAAYFVVADAKNYTGQLKKVDVLQLTNYLTPHGAGLFGVLVTRNSSDNGANVTRREKWAIERKLMIVLNDSDLEQMILTKREGGDPSESIRQKIEDFRLSY